ncbi:MAG: VWA domain-containing protein [Candidatus Omnitrophica bacterium]|nr:VWA domain-containing protein [Candidatus Omnitrophota bacterium]
MRWQHPYFLNMLFLLPLLFYLSLYATRAKRRLIEAFGSEEFREKVERSVHPGRRWTRAFLLLFGFLFLVVALASPQTSSPVKIKKKLGSEFFLALDVSLSMLAQDETPSRLAKAKKELLQFLEKLEGYRVGLIIFSGTSFVQCPLTMDHHAIRYFLESVDTQSLPVPGSAFKKAIENARKSFGEEKGTRKYLVLFSDGEDLEGEDPLPVAREASREGIAIFCIGFGSPTGALIPLHEKGVFVGYKKDLNGVTVVTHANEELLTKIAHETRGHYFKSTAGFEELDTLWEEVAKRGRKEVTEASERQYESRFQVPLFLAVLFLVVEMILSETRRIHEGESV